MIYDVNEKILHHLSSHFHLPRTYFPPPLLSRSSWVLNRVLTESEDEYVEYFEVLSVRDVVDELSVSVSVLEVVPP